MGRVSLLSHRADEADTLADDRADQPLLFTIVADNAACGVDPAGECRFGHDPPAPDRSQQIVLADHPIAVADEENEQVEHLRFDGQQRRPLAKFAPVLSRA